MFFKKLLSLSIIILVFSLVVAIPVLAQGINDASKILTDTGTQAGAGSSDLVGILGTVVKTALTLVGMIFMILMVYAGYLWLMARGNEEEVKKAEGIIKTSIIGIVVVMSAYAITYFVIAKLGQ
jgi:isoprenylcysteine carboxyl methyltransferase (ICMT) family protein YpbQ